jgi:transcriptional regulator with XRE-family HTH domain
VKGDGKMEPLGKKIRVLRRENCLTQVELAEKVQANSNYVAMIERGERSPSPKLLKKIARVFQTSVRSITSAGDIMSKAKGWKCPNCGSTKYSSAIVMSEDKTVFDVVSRHSEVFIFECDGCTIHFGDPEQFQKAGKKPECGIKW